MRQLILNRLASIWSGFLSELGVDGVAGNLGLMLRQHVIRRDRWSLYADVGESLFEADHDVPRSGTH